MTRYPIGSVARETGISVDAIRYFERCGILPALSQSQGRNRLFSLDEIRRILFAKRAQALGFSLDEIRNLLALGTDAHGSCELVKAHAAQRRKSVERKIRDLCLMRNALDALIAGCSRGGLAADACPILESLTLQNSDHE